MIRTVFRHTILLSGPRNRRDVRIHSAAMEKNWIELF